MCGLVGVVSKSQNGFTQRQKDIFSTLLFIDTLRGDDSTGAFTVKNNGDLLMAKNVGAALPFMKTPEYDKLLSTAFSTGAAMVGHNRKATRGIINDENAHPFVVDDRIVLVHNGTLYGDHKQHADVEVDSHAIAHLLAKHDVASTINKINGAFALIWYDFHEATLNFLRNSQRPLFWVETPQEWIWSSEDSMLYFIRDRYDLKFNDSPAMLPEHTLCTYTLENKTWKLGIEKFTHTPPVVKTPTYNYTHRGGRSSGADDVYGFDNLNDGERCNWQFGQWHRERFPEDPPANTNTGTLHDVDTLRKSLLVNGQGVCTVTSKEHDLGLRCGNLITVEEFGEINKKYPYNTTVHAQVFDATCVNEVDDRAGMFLWLYPSDDTSVVLRYRYAPNQVTEEQAINIASSGCIYKCNLQHRGWIKVPNISNGSKSVGWVLFNLSSMALVEEVKNEQGEKVVH